MQFGPVCSRCAPFSGLQGPETIKKGHHTATSDFYTIITTATTATSIHGTYQVYLDRAVKLLLLLIAILPRFHGTYQIYLDRAVWAGWQPLRPFSGLQILETVKKGHHRCLPVLPVIYKCSVNCSAVWAGWQPLKLFSGSGLSVVYFCDYNTIITTATIATNCYTTTLSWNLPDRAVWAGWQPLRPFSGLHRPKGSPQRHFDYTTITIATTATNCYTTTLSWNLPDLP